ncbi:MAG: hypothetical protein IJY33_01955 [Oscillospiraceae bacterium]|nr:hypothetical protein [Oscillospiraceae bacterium]
MNKGEILKKRKTLCQQAGKSEYFFFTSILLSAAAFCLIAVLATDLFMKTPEVSAAYGEFFGGEIVIKDGEHPFLKASAEVAEALIKWAAGVLPTLAVLFVSLVFIVCPIAQGTIRWGAYLTETGSALPIGAIMFYFTSARLYFSSVLLTLRLFLKKGLSALGFMFPPVFCIFLSLILGSDYYGQKTLAGGCLILSLVWLVLAAALCVVFCQRYAAVRYLFALGSTKKIFRRSKEVTKERRVWFALFNLRLLPNLLLILAVFTAPLALSRIIAGHCLAVKEAIKEKRCQSA